MENIFHVNNSFVVSSSQFLVIFEVYNGINWDSRSDLPVVNSGFSQRNLFIVEKATNKKMAASSLLLSSADIVNGVLSHYHNTAVTCNSWSYTLCSSMREDNS